MKKITLLLFMVFLSVCGYAQLNQQTFETWPVTAGDWYRYQNSTGTAQQWTQGTPGSSTAGVDNSHSAYITNQSVPPGSDAPLDYLVTEAFIVPDSPKLMFMSRFNATGDQGSTIELLITEVTNPSNLGDPATATYATIAGPITESQMNPFQQNWTLKEFPIDGSWIGKTVRIAFKYKGNNNNTTERWFIDNVQVVKECVKPVFTVTNPTTTTLQVNITSNPAGATDFAVEIVLADDAPSGVADYTFTGTTFTTPTGDLTENTDYKVYVWALCSPTNPSEIAGPVEASTVPLGATCVDPKVITQLPYQTTDNTANYADIIDGAPGTTGCGTTASYLNGFEVFYAYTATFTGDVSIVMTGNGNSSGMFVYTSCTNVGQSCAAGGIGNATNPVSIPNFAVTAGQTYYIVISTSGNVASTPYTLTVQPASCAPPTNLSAPTVGATSANLTWGNPGGFTSWNVVVQPQGTGIPTATTEFVVANTNTAFLVTQAQGGPINEATNYEYYVRADCNNGTYSAWAGPFLFTTKQTPADLNYSQDFELPLHNWTLSNGTQTNKWVVGTAVNNGGTKSLYVSNDGGASNAYTITSASTVHAYRDITIPAIPTQQITVSFDWRAAGQTPNNDYFKVWLAPTTYNPNPGSLVSGQTAIGATFNNSGTSWTTSEYTISTAGIAAGSTRRLIFEWRNDGSVGTQPPAAIDNINVKIVTCREPSALAVPAATITANDAVATWTAPVGGAGGYDYFLATSDTPAPDDSTVETGSSPTNSVTVATVPNTRYYIWVRSDCGNVNGKSKWIGPVSFLTPQIPAVLPYIDDFEAATPAVTIANGTQTNKWVIGTAVSNGGTKSLYVSNDNGVSNAYTITSASVVHTYRDLAIPNNTEQLKVSFDWRGVGQNVEDRLRVYLVPLNTTLTPGTQITANAQNIPVGLTNYSENSSWQTYTAIVPAIAMQNSNRRLVFEWRNNASTGTQTPAAVDNINVSVVPCPAPTNLVAGVTTATTAPISWTGPTTVTPTYDFYVNTNVSNAPADTTTPTGTTPTASVTLDDEIPAGSTNFYVWVRSNCGSVGNSPWVGPLQVNLPQVPVNLAYEDNLEGAIGWTVNNGTQANKWVVGSATSNSPSTSLYISNNNAANAYTTTTASVTHVYRDINIPTTTASVLEIGISFDWRAVGEGTADRLRVWLVPTSTTLTPGTQIAAGANRELLGEFSESAAWKNQVYVRNQFNYQGQTRRLVFEWRNDGSGGLQTPAAVDNITVKQITCPAVTNLTVAGTGAGVGEVTLGWTPQGTETEWEIVIIPQGASAPGPNPPSVISITNGVPSHTLTLPAGIIYEFYVRPKCSPTDKGFWAGPEVFSIFLPPACAKVDMYDQELNLLNPGQQISICPGEDACIDLTAQYLQTGNTTSYAVETIDYAPQFPFTGGIALNIATDDIWGPAFTFPTDFNFCFYGAKQTKATVGSNGVVSFNTHTVNSNCPWDFNALQIPNTAFPIKNAIYGVYQDLNPRVNNDFAHPSINYQILGTYPCRAFVVNFSEVAQFDSDCQDDPAIGAQTSQIVFYEITNIIEVYVKRRVPCMEWPTTAARAGQGVIGIQNAAGTAAVAPPGRNTGPWTAIEEAYRFTPNGPSNSQFEWFKGTELYSTNPQINVCITEPTTMTARVTYTGCGITPAVIESKVIITPEQPIIITNPVDLTQCVPNPGDNATFNLLDGMLGAIPNPENYTFTFYDTAQKATDGVAGTELPVSYTTNANQTIHVRAQLTGRSCFGTDSFEINVAQPPVFDLPDDFTVCQGNPFTIPVTSTTFDVNGPNVSYVWKRGTDVLPETTSSITVTGAGIYEVTVTLNGCTATQSVEVDETPSPVVDMLPDVTECESFILPALTPGNKYFTATGGGGTQLAEGATITTSQTIYVRVDGATPGCNAEDSFVVTILQKPVLAPVSPVVTCAAEGYQLPALTVGNYYDAPNGTGNMLNAGQTLFTSQTVYVYAVTPGTSTLCASEASFTISVEPDITADVLAPVTRCDEFVLDALSANNNYYTGPNKTGNLLPAGTVITQSATLYIYAEVGSCNDESTFNITIVPEPLDITISEDCIGGKYILGVRFNNGEINYNPGNVVYEWSRTQGGAVIGTTPTIQALDAGDYFVRISPTGSTVTCYAEDMVNIADIQCDFPIQKGISPNGDGLNDTFDLTRLNVSKLSIFNRYGREVYSYSNYTDQWHGQSDNGGELPSGTYYYMVQRANGENTTGWVYINREE